MTLWQRLAGLIASEGCAALVSLREVQGSTPREAGARMVVSRQGAISGTVGGGTLEHDLMGRAVGLMQTGMQAGADVRHVLGPDLGQCCGGVVTASIEVFTAEDMIWIAPLAVAGQAGALTTQGHKDAAGRWVRQVAVQGPSGLVETFGIISTPVLLFGAGHVGRALVMALAPLPFSITWVDGRAGAFPPVAPAHVRMVHAADPAAEIAAAPDNALVVVMTHDHALDQALVMAALGAGRFSYVGLIGSQSKRGRFLTRLAQAGLSETAQAQLVCPIGGRALADKHPAVIAAAIVVELLQQRERIAMQTA